MFDVPERFRVTDGLLASTHADGNNGAFMIVSAAADTIKYKLPLAVIASDQMGWEHVSVSLPHRCPTWEEMCFIKDIFWGADDFVVQMHPARKDYINNHPYCLHLWRKAGTNNFCQKPPNIMVGLPGGIFDPRKSEK
jgi:hypothetical protein